jgi:membrane protease YdiL (CAAX protease family)
MRLEFKLPPESLWLVPAGIAVCFAGSVVNTLIMNLVIPSEVLNSLVEQTGPYRPYQIVLQLIATALVPAVCEEFLFRGAVASSLMPFGKTTAIVGSSVLFALMHQNMYQIFYTLFAGLFLGYLYVKTESILCPTILHFCNNATSVLLDVCNTNMGEDRGELYYYIITVFIYLIGAAAVIVYFSIEKKKGKQRLEGGSFGRIIESVEDHARMPVTNGKRLRYFLTPAMIIYISLAVFNALSTAAALFLISL